MVPKAAGAAHAGKTIVIDARPADLGAGQIGKAGTAQNGLRAIVRRARIGGRRQCPRRPHGCQRLTCTFYRMLQRSKM